MSQLDSLVEKDRSWELKRFPTLLRFADRIPFGFGSSELPSVAADFETNRAALPSKDATGKSVVMRFDQILDTEQLGSLVLTGDVCRLHQLLHVDAGSLGNHHMVPNAHTSPAIRSPSFVCLECFPLASQCQRIVDLENSRECHAKRPIARSGWASDLVKGYPNVVHRGEGSSAHRIATGTEVPHDGSSPRLNGLVRSPNVTFRSLSASYCSVCKQVVRENDLLTNDWLRNYQPSSSAGSSSHRFAVLAPASAKAASATTKLEDIAS